MQLLAYVTRDEIEQHAPVFDVPISRIAQIFAADIMPQQSKNYDAKCAASYVDADHAAVVSQATSPRTRLLIPHPLSTLSTYAFQGYRPGCLEAFLLQPIYNDVATPHADTAPNVNQGDYRCRLFPLPSAVDRDILQISKQHMCKPSNKAASNTAPAPLTPKLGNQAPGTARRTQKTSGQERAREERAGKGSKVLVQAVESTAAQKPDIHLTSNSMSALFGAPIVTKLLSSQVTGGDSRSSISSTSTLDDWEGEDESIFQNAADPSVSSSLAADGLNCVAPPPQPPLQSSLTPIISIGRKTEAALAIAGLPDMVHTYLQNLVSTKVNTAWISCLQAAPLSLSSATAAAIYTAVVRDIASTP